MSHPAPLVIGHRGSPQRAPENTLAGLIAAAEDGADGIEVDLRLAGDGAVAVIHDDTLDRTTTGSGPVSDVNATHLGALGVPTLGEVVRVCAERMLFANLEIKEPEPALAAAVAASAATLVGGAGLVVSSFVPSALEMVAERDPGIPVALLTLPGVTGDAALAAAQRYGGWNPFFTTLLDDPAWVTRAHDVGVRVIAWTVDDEDAIAALARTGCDGIVTNVPAAARRVLFDRRAGLPARARWFAPRGSLT